MKLSIFAIPVGKVGIQKQSSEQDHEDAGPLRKRAAGMVQGITGPTRFEMQRRYLDTKANEWQSRQKTERQHPPEAWRRFERGSCRRRQQHPASHQRQKDETLKLRHGRSKQKCQSQAEPGAVLSHQPESALHKAQDGEENHRQGAAFPLDVFLGGWQEQQTQESE